MVGGFSLSPDRELNSVFEMFMFFSDVVAERREQPGEDLISILVAIKEGDLLMTLFASANRDESTWGPDAAEFRVDRDASDHVAFGSGVHLCLVHQPVDVVPA